jgi:hypothetical protein
VASRLGCGTGARRLHPFTRSPIHAGKRPNLLR